MEECIKLAIEDMNSGISYHEALYRYGMSKMTVAKENMKNEEKIPVHGRWLYANSDYLFMEFVEFMEYLARIAVLVYDRNKLYYGHGKQE